MGSNTPTHDSADAATQPYKVSEIALFAPQNKKLRIVMIGAGVSGIMMTYRIQKHLENVDFKVYERNADIGGTWLLNRYPGCACDIPSHAYTYSFALNPDWPSFFSPAQDIWAYLDKVAKTWDLRKYMTFSTEAIKCEWQAESSTWKVHLRQTSSDGTIRDFVEECDVLLHATGVLNNFKWPTIKGIEKFKGRLIHTARWDENYQKEEWSKDRVGVIGSGASSIQTVPTMQPHVKHMEVFVRTPVWFVEIAGNDGKNIPYTDEQKKEFRSNLASLVEHAKSLEDKVNFGWDMMIQGSPTQKMARDHYVARTSSIIQNKEILSGILPKWSVGCRRITPGDPYMMAIQEPNVHVNFTEVVEITESTIIGKNGAEKEVDTIVCATGFDTSFRPGFPIIGKNGVDLAKKWARAPEAYLGLGVPDFPNFFTFIGPSWPIGNGSVIGPLEAVGDYVIKMLQKMQNELILSFEPKQEITDMFNEHVQEYMKKTVWMDDCRSWYKDPETNRVNAIWPGGSLHYIDSIREPRYEDYEIKYAHRNIFTYLGNGYPRAALIEGSDMSPYLAVDRVDKDWLKA